MSRFLQRHTWEECLLGHIKKKKWKKSIGQRKYLRGSSVIEMSYIMPLFLLLFVLIIHAVFYYHDKAYTERQGKQRQWELRKNGKKRAGMTWRDFSESG